MTEHIHWKRLTAPDFLGAYSLDENKDAILTIRSVGREIVTGADGKKDECTVAHFAEKTAPNCPEVKPMILNNTNCKIIQKLYNTPYVDQWQGKPIQIYVDHNVKVGKETVDGLRIRPFKPQPVGQTVPDCSDCSKPIEPYGKITAAVYASSTQIKFGRPLCYACSIKADQVAKQQADPLGAGQIGMEGAE